MNEPFLLLYQEPLDFIRDITFPIFIIHNTSFDKGSSNEYKYNSQIN